MSPVPTPSKGLLDVGFKVPNRIADPISPRVIKIDRNVITPAKTDPQEMFVPASSSVK